MNFFLAYRLRPNVFSTKLLSSPTGNVFVQGKKYSFEHFFFRKKMNLFTTLFTDMTFKVSTHLQLVPTTSLCNKSQRLVARIQTSLNFWEKSLRLVSQNASCELFVGQVPSFKLALPRARYQGPGSRTCPYSDQLESNGE